MSKEGSPPVKCSKCGAFFDTGRHKRTIHGVCLRCVRDWIRDSQPYTVDWNAETRRTADHKQAYDPE